MRTFSLLLFVLATTSVSAQFLRHNFDEKGNTYIKATLRGQFWTRYAETNPGTTINGEATNQTFDFSIRRYRIGVFAQVTPKLVFYILTGSNNINQKTDRPYYIRMLDFYAQYQFNEQFALGIGKIAWGGPGRYSVFSNRSMLNLDPTIFELFTLDHSDDMGRNLGVYAKGQINKFDYVISLQSPARPTTAQITSFGYAENRPRTRFSSYVKYEFWDDESSSSSYSGAVGTYIGTKKIFNIGVGYVHQAKMLEQTIGTETAYSDYKNLGIDLFLDTPISQRNAAITAYLGYNNVDLGKNYVRNVGVNGIYDSAGTSFNGGGTAYPMIGTGNTLFFQLGYLLPKPQKGNIRIQPNVGWKYSDFKALNQAVNSYDVGVNVYFNGHYSKLSLNYENRPIFNASTLKETERKGMVVLQYQIEL